MDFRISPACLRIDPEAKDLRVFDGEPQVASEASVSRKKPEPIAGAHEARRITMQIRVPPLLIEECCGDLPVGRFMGEDVAPVPHQGPEIFQTCLKRIGKVDVEKCENTITLERWQRFVEIANIEVTNINRTVPRNVSFHFLKRPLPRPLRVGVNLI
jgi:hypothetical protein